MLRRRSGDRQAAAATLWEELTHMAQIATFYDHIKDISRQRGISLMDAMGLARQLGVEALEVNQNNMIGREDEVGQELAFHDMSISAVPSYFDFGRDPDVARQALPTLEAASYLGAKKAPGHPRLPGQGRSPPGAGAPDPGHGGRRLPPGGAGGPVRPLPGDGGVRQPRRPLQHHPGGAAVFTGLPGPRQLLRHRQLPPRRGGRVGGLGGPQRPGRPRAPQGPGPGRGGGRPAHGALPGGGREPCPSPKRWSSSGPRATTAPTPWSSTTPPTPSLS